MFVKGFSSQTVFVKFTMCLWLQWFLDEIKKEPLLNLVGVHSHLGSTITKVWKKEVLEIGLYIWSLYLLVSQLMVGAAV